MFATIRVHTDKTNLKTRSRDSEPLLLCTLEFVARKYHENHKQARDHRKNSYPACYYTLPEARFSKSKPGLFKINSTEFFGKVISYVVCMLKGEVNLLVVKVTAFR